MLALVGMLCGSVLARKSYMVKEYHKLRVPSVTATTYPEYKVFENNDDDFTI